MKWFRKRENNTQHKITVETEYHSKGLLIKVMKNQHPLRVPFKLSPLEYRSVESPDLLQLIEELWYDELLGETGQYYSLGYDTVYELENVERLILGLPKEPIDLKMEIKNKSFVGSPNFQLDVVYHYDEYFNLQDFAKKNGPIIRLPNGEFILINQEQHDLLELVANMPHPRNTDELFPFVAQVKSLAKELQIPISEHLERESYEFIKDIELDIQKENDALSIFPVYSHETLPKDVLTSMSNNAGGYVKKDGHRIFLDKKARDQSALVKEIPTITGSDVPKFVDHFESFIPEELNLSLDRFGERVKNLGIRVYKAQPFVHANQSNRGWFEFETGFHVKDQEGEIISQLSLEDVETITDLETNDDGYFQLENGDWIKTPSDTGDFIKTAKDVTKQMVDSKPDSLAKAMYFLVIFENFDQVDYNEPIHEVKQSIKDSNVLETTPPDLFNATLKPFQQDGFVWMKSLRFSGYGGLLADDMGLGKTIQVIAFLSYLKEQEKLLPSIIILPKTLIENWCNEMSKFAPSLTSKIYIHQGADRIKDAIWINKQEITLTTYQTLVRDQLILGQIDWQAIISDEAQAIKNPTTAASKVLKALKAKFRLALTGTPVENTITELWSIVDFVQPGLLGSLKQFNEAYLKPIQAEGANYQEIKNKLEQKIRFIYKRRTKAGELGDQLPSKVFLKEPCTMSKEQGALYTQLISDVKEKKIPAIEAIMKLKMLLSHPALLDSNLRTLHYKKIPKILKTIDIINQVKERNEKVLIFTEYRQMQTILKEVILQEFEINAPIINGATERRQGVVDEFNRQSGFDVMILSPKAAGTGLTITSANHVIHYTRWWNPAVENQATDRVYRIGQEKDVTVYYPIVTSQNQEQVGQTVEEIVDRLLTEKQDLANNIIVPSTKLNIEDELVKLMQVH